MEEKRFSYWHGSIAKRKLITESWIEDEREKGFLIGMVV